MTDFESDTRDLLIRGVAAAKDNDSQEAAFYLKWLLRLDPMEAERLEALYWLSQVSSDPAEARGYLEDILASDPGEPRARRQLAILDGQLKLTDIVDPDHAPRPAPGKPLQPAADRFTCPKCGGRMAFAPDGQSLVCEYCETRQHLGYPPVAKPGVKEGDFVIAMATAKGRRSPTTEHTFTCQGCGAVFLLPADQLTVTCPYCQSNYALKQTASQELIPPDGLMPFRIDQAKGQAILKDWLASRQASLPETGLSLHAIYVPVWSFSLDGRITWHGTQVQRRLPMPASGEEPVMIGNLLVLATRRLPEILRPAIGQFDLAQLIPFDDRYLANSLAETYQAPVDEASLEARQRVVEAMQRKVMESQSGNIRDLLLNSSEMEIESFKLILLPFWIGHAASPGQPYEVLVNGQNGMVTCDRSQAGVHHWFSRKTS